MPAVGIDLGTTSSAVALLKGRPVVVEDVIGNRTLPSAVGWDPDLEHLVVGHVAKSNPDLYRTVLSIKRKMGSDERVQIGPHSWLPEQVSAEILKVLKKQVEEKTGEEVTEAIITVPAYFQLAQKAKTIEAGNLAGLKVQQLLEEPSAAIMAYGPQDDEKILVYDLGGGTFDVTLIDCFAGALTTKAVFGNNFLGGDDFDHRLVDHFRAVLKQKQGVTLDDKDRQAFAILKKAAENAKIEMSRMPGTRISIPRVVEVQGRPIGLEMVIKTADFDAMIRDLIQNTLTEVEKALNHARLDKSDIDTILLVGGSTYYPLVRKMVRDFFGKEPNTKVNPDLAVAMGAAASLLQEAPRVGGRHTIVVGFLPDRTPEKTVTVCGRTTPKSQVRITGGAQPSSAVADDEGEYTIEVPLKNGSNQFVVTALSPRGDRATTEPEPVQFDPKSRFQEEPPPPPAPILSRGLSISHGLTVGRHFLRDIASVIMEAQSELPCEAISEQFATAADNQRELKGLILEGDLPLATLNTQLAEISLKLPPNVPANEQVIVTFTVDENSRLTAELEVPGVHRKGQVTVNLKSPAAQVHIFQQLENLLTVVGSRIRKEERSVLDSLRASIEDLSADFRRAQDDGDAEAVGNAYDRLRASAQKLRVKMEEMQKKYR